MDRGPSMVPTSGSFSTPMSTSARQSGGQPGAAYPQCGPLPPESLFGRPSELSAQWPTPGVAYASFPGALSSQQQPAMHMPPDAAQAEIAALTAQLAAAMGEIRHLSNIVRSAASPAPEAMPLRIPLANMMNMQSSPWGTDHQSIGASFATITSSRTSDGSADFDEDLLPVPAAAAHALATGRATDCDDVFSSKELQSLACSCEPDALAEWDTTFLGRVSSRRPAAYKALMFTDAEIAALPPPARAVVRGYDSVMAGHILATLQGSSPDVKLVRKRIAAREKRAPGSVTSSGRVLRAIILENLTPTCGSELQELEDELEKPFFSINMNGTAVRLAAHRLQALREQLPPSARGGEREMLRALILKFPAELAAKAAGYKAKMCKAEIRKKSYSWTYDELTAILAADIASVTPTPAEANAADGPGRKDLISR